MARRENLMRIVIAGAAGFIGCHLAKRYLDEGHEVIGVDNLVTGQKANVDWLSAQRSFHFINHDVIGPLDIAGPVDLVCDLACPASPVDFALLGVEILRVCSEGVRHLMELALDKGAVFLHTSTSEVYGDAEVHPQDESYWGHVNPIGPRAVYDEGKRFAEALITTFHRRRGLTIRLARIFNTFGPRMRLDDGRGVTIFICQALTNRPLSVYGQGTQTRSFCYIDDQVEGLVRLAKSSYSGPVNIGNPEEIPIRQLAQEVIELADSSSTITELPMPPDDPKVRCPDITLARRELGWQPQVSRRAGLQQTIAFCKQLGPRVLQQASGGRVFADSPAPKAKAPALKARMGNV
jgi:dTDP-glucose 4,6-dehydratase